MLTDAIIRSGKTRAQFAAELGIGRPFLSLLESGRKRPSLELAVRIERLTAGHVPAASWIEDLPLPSTNTENPHDPAFPERA